MHIKHHIQPLIYNDVPLCVCSAEGREKRILKGNKFLFQVFQQ